MPAPLATKLLYSHEQPLPSKDEWEEPMVEPTREDIEKDFEVFYWADSEDTLASAHRHLVVAQVSTSQEVADVSEAMLLEEKTLDLLALLTTYIGGNTLVVPIVPQPLNFDGNGNKGSDYDWMGLLPSYWAT